MTDQYARSLRRTTARVLFVPFFVWSLFAPLITVAAEGEVPQTGPTVETGPTQPTGTTVETGPTQPTGPTGPTGTSVVEPEPCTDPSCFYGMGQGEGQGVDQGVGQGVPAAAAATPTGTLANDTTGAGSTNTNSATENNSTDITNRNNATITNDVDMSLSTGSNTLSQNSEVGSLTTGDIRGSLSIVNAANSQFAPGSSVGLGTATSGADGVLLMADGSRAYLPSNSQTGADSTNTNAISGTNAVRIVTESTALVDNDIDIAASTGGNTITENTLFGDITTGSIDLAVNLINLLNLLMPDTLFMVDLWNLYGDVLGDIFAPLTNSQTGAGSTNTNAVSGVNTADVTVTSIADTTNTFNITTDTGSNVLDQNTAVSDVSTGDVRIDGSVTNISNAATPTFYIVNVLGKWNGGALALSAGSYIINELGNWLTGADSTNTNTVDQTNTLDMDITNTATVNNGLNISASTGGNTIARNTAVGNVTTGDINIMANVVNFLNSFGGDLSKFSLGVINIFGDWGKKPTPAPVVPQAVGLGQGGAPVGEEQDAEPMQLATVTTATQGKVAEVAPQAPAVNQVAPAMQSVVRRPVTQLTQAPAPSAATSAGSSVLVAGTSSVPTAADLGLIDGEQERGSSVSYLWIALISLGVIWGVLELAALRKQRA
ncbi:MAG: hypothetical protein ACOYBJ_00385 [Patescibacteria group bacterium]|jgi:hypothetical protein